ncbi:hypothetical protein ACNOYE_38360 [Nannocystaceae bacterium ST9]
MWSTSEREDLAVWADGLQQAGDPWGELVATSLAAETAQEPSHARLLEDRLLELERSVWQPRVGPLLEGWPEIQARWEHGMLTSLGVFAEGERCGEPLRERVAALLRLPAARCLWHVHVDLRTSRWSAHDEVAALLLDPECRARPRGLMFGPAPRRVDRCVPFRHRDGPRVHGELGLRLAEPSRGLVSLVEGNSRLILPWVRGDGGTRRQAAERIAARVRDHGGRISTNDRTLLGRALWDPSSRARIAALEGLTELDDDDAAPFVPDLLLVGRERPEWVAAWREIEPRLLARPGIVARLNANFMPEQRGVLRWIREQPELDPRVRARITAMLDQPLPRRLRDDLWATLKKFTAPSPAPDSGPREPAPNEAPHVHGELGRDGLDDAFDDDEPGFGWIDRLRAWWRR